MAQIDELDRKISAGLTGARAASASIPALPPIREVRATNRLPHNCFLNIQSKGEGQMRFDFGTDAHAMAALAL
ncbi:MAG TPA: hypothetical protein VGX03_30540 [Candidatus Binatia bacterium]|nr:hypothetical protein [Candidatus Binatia bacterium]